MPFNCCPNTDDVRVGDQDVCINCDKVAHCGIEYERFKKPYLEFALVGFVVLVGTLVALSFHPAYKKKFVKEYHCYELKAGVTAWDAKLDCLVIYDGNGWQCIDNSHYLNISDYDDFQVAPPQFP